MTVETGKATHYGQQRFLGRIGCVCIVAGDAPTNGQNPIEMDAEERVDGSGLPALRGGQKKFRSTAVDEPRLLTGRVHHAHLRHPHLVRQFAGV